MWSLRDGSVSTLGVGGAAFCRPLPRDSDAPEPHARKTDHMHHSTHTERRAAPQCKHARCLRTQHTRARPWLSTQGGVCQAQCATRSAATQSVARTRHMHDAHATVDTRHPVSTVSHFTDVCAQSCLLPFFVSRSSSLCPVRLHGPDAFLCCPAVAAVNVLWTSSLSGFALALWCLPGKGREVEVSRRTPPSSSTWTCGFLERRYVPCIRGGGVLMAVSVEENKTGSRHSSAPSRRSLRFPTPSERGNAAAKLPRVGLPAPRERGVVQISRSASLSLMTTFWWYLPSSLTYVRRAVWAFFTSAEDRKLVNDVNGSEEDLLALGFSGPSNVSFCSFGIVRLGVADTSFTRRDNSVSVSPGTCREEPARSLSSASLPSSRSLSCLQGTPPCSMVFIRYLQTLFVPNSRVVVLLKGEIPWLLRGLSHTARST